MTQKTWQRSANSADNRHLHDKSLNKLQPNEGDLSKHPLPTAVEKLIKNLSPELSEIIIVEMV